jgi:hypothetical protein
MFLISELAIGFPDAPSGSALIRKHGLSTSASAYEDFDGDSGATTHTLDANGRVTRYVDEIVDVTVLDVDGATVATFTPAACATSVVVRNNMFTGTTSDGTIEAGGLTTLDSALDKLQLSLGGGEDGNVVVNGQETTIADALASAGASTVYNVVTYGAVGDGTTDDSAAVQLAINAAQGTLGDILGVVYFPTGKTYLMNVGVSVAYPISIEGGGDGSVITATGNSSKPFSLVGAGADATTGIRNLKFTLGTAASSSTYAISVASTYSVRIDGCTFINNAYGAVPRAQTYAVYQSSSPSVSLTNCLVRGMRVHCNSTSENSMNLSGCTLIDAQLTGGATVVAASSFRQTSNANHGFIYESGGSTSSFSVSGSRFVGFYSTTPITSATQGFRGSFFSGGNAYSNCVALDTSISYTGASSYIDKVRDGSRVSSAMSGNATWSYTPSQQYGIHTLYSVTGQGTILSSGFDAAYAGAGLVLNVLGAGASTVTFQGTTFKTEFASNRYNLTSSEAKSCTFDRMLPTTAQSGIYQCAFSTATY